MAARKDNPPKPLTHEDIDFLRAVHVAMSHVAAHEGERDLLERAFNEACTERGLEPATIDIVIEAFT